MRNKSLIFCCMLIFAFCIFSFMAEASNKCENWESGNYGSPDFDVSIDFNVVGNLYVLSFSASQDYDGDGYVIADNNNQNKQYFIPGDGKLAIPVGKYFDLGISRVLLIDRGVVTFDEEKRYLFGDGLENGHLGEDLETFEHYLDRVGGLYVELLSSPFVMSYNPQRGKIITAMVPDQQKKVDRIKGIFSVMFGIKESSACINNGERGIIKSPTRHYNFVEIRGELYDSKNKRTIFTESVTLVK